MNLFVKPQGKGGGNDIYKSLIASLLETLSTSEPAAWIAMELIWPRKPMGNWLVRACGAAEGAMRSEVVSELEIFGWTLFGSDGKKEAGKKGEG